MIRKLLIPLLLSGSITSMVYAQECEKLLSDGLYSFTKMTNTNSFSHDLRTYYLSEIFKSDMKSGKWGASLTIPIKGVPFSIGANDSEDKYTELKTKLLSITELNIGAENAQMLLQSVPNTNLYEAYVNCVTKNGQNNLYGFIQGTNVETEDAVVFTIHYRPSSPGDSMPKVTSFNVYPTSALLSGKLDVGESLKGFTTLVTCKRPANEDVILTIQTDRGSFSSKASAQDNMTGTKEFPIGTIITSYLNYEQFNTVTKNHDKSPGGIFTSNKSKWAPCDGRPVPNSKFQILTSQINVPDLRGMFVRGLNIFDPYQPVPAVTKEKSDPDTRVVGGYQSDSFQGHKHLDKDNVGVLISEKQAPNTPRQRYTVEGTAAVNTEGRIPAGYGDPRISTETRPKNISVYYYIKIN
ncbi:tail fiber protein [Pedobacter riviphilus]|uniref:Tail fiber protein n=1 Tax=Pedobacter riviphilus TaxID=2766984 RepID=A0ABX6TIF6_9SPHI|nr:phage tail protein [Pedobacter riviphilus]QNR83025.1 tail fiber protein [Pedobacter riviphilus]